MIIDSQMTRAEALAQNPAHPSPQHILDELELLTASYWGFDGKEHRGQLVLHRDLVTDVIMLLTQMHHAHFPLGGMVPIADAKFAWSDDASMASNNCSAFNYRTIAGSTKLSLHAFGRALDLNPILNPMIKNGVTSPPRAVYEPSAPGTFVSGGPFVTFMESRGWIWGGHWKAFKDYHHFQKR